MYNLGVRTAQRFLLLPPALEERHNDIVNESEDYERQWTGWRPNRVAFMILGSTVLSVMLWGWGYWQRRAFSDSSCTLRTSRNSPILADIDVGLSTIAFNGSFFSETIFRQAASPEVDAAWESLGVNYRAAIVPESQASVGGLTPRQVRVSKKYGGGYPANVEGMHHLHCLNLLRQALFFNYDYYKALGGGAFKNEDYVLQAHITHCLDTLRQQLMCVVDVGVLGQIWWDTTYPKAFPDFNTKHNCRDFDKVRKWAEEHQGPEHPPEDYLRPPRRDDVLEGIP
ncbi:Tat pathway signal sequence [Pleurostoma richardsiae]|uniref:Tat pathway signal sequence n=1 Tax=Pleurostoma richardsiae TaxID=41990 RepID=A0AA38RNM0_9PEZI|nr:Tat pathway signal sequence [Pleurostoma richardsiae]